MIAMRVHNLVFGPWAGPDAWRIRETLRNSGHAKFAKRYSSRGRVSVIRENRRFGKLSY